VNDAAAHPPALILILWRPLPVICWHSLGRRGDIRPSAAL